MAIEKLHTHLVVQFETPVDNWYKEFPLIAIIGPRPSDKTTISQKVFKNHTM